VGNLGDSRAVLGRKHAGAVAAVALTSDHKPDRPDERRRVLAAGGQVGSRQLVVGHSAKGPVTMPLGPARVWYTTRGDTMGLAMSRSFGVSGRQAVENVT
jgi:serine/threonine protein phosphatase PrpC